MTPAKRLRDGLGRPLDPAALYYVQDTRSVVGNCALWWAPNGAGYVCDVAKAGKYTTDSIADMRTTDVAWPVETVAGLIRQHVDVQSLHTIKAAKR